jgi:hypothetical protein
MLFLSIKIDNIFVFIMGKGFIFGGAYASHTLKMGDYGGNAPVIPHFKHSAKRCAPKNTVLPYHVTFKKRKGIKMQLMQL